MVPQEGLANVVPGTGDDSVLCRDTQGHSLCACVRLKPGEFVEQVAVPSVVTAALPMVIGDDHSWHRADEPVVDRGALHAWNHYGIVRYPEMLRRLDLHSELMPVQRPCFANDHEEIHTYVFRGPLR